MDTPVTVGNHCVENEIPAALASAAGTKNCLELSSTDANKVRPRARRVKLISHGAAARRLGDLRRVMAPETGRGRDLGYWRSFGFFAANALCLFKPGRYFERGRKVPRRWPEATVETALGPKNSPARASIDAIVDRHGTYQRERIYAAIAEGMRDGERWTLNRGLVGDQEAAKRLLVDSDERDELHLRSIGAVDSTPEVRKLEASRRKRERDRERKATERRAAGAQPRAEYERNSTSKARPWKALGISRATYYRLGRVETGPSPHNNTDYVSIDKSVGDGPVSRPTPIDDFSIDGRLAQASDRSSFENSSDSEKTIQLATLTQTIEQRLPAPQALIVGGPPSLSELALLALYAREKASGRIREASR